MQHCDTLQVKFKISHPIWLVKGLRARDWSLVLGRVIKGK